MLQVVLIWLITVRHSSAVCDGGSEVGGGDGGTGGGNQLVIVSSWFRM